MPLSTLKALVEAGKKCTAYDLTTCQTYDDGETLECPMCDGEGYIEGCATYTNFDNEPLGVQFFGIGESHENWSRFLRDAANARPALAALLEVLEGIDAEALGEAISEMEERIECIKRPDDYPKEKYKTTWAIYEAAKAMQKIIGGG